jgi:hypothetical protein
MGSIMLSAGAELRHPFCRCLLANQQVDERACEGLHAVCALDPATERAPSNIETEIAMQTTLRARFWLETGLALLSACLLVLTLIWPDWIETITGFEPDNHSGSVEWALVATLLIVSVVAGILARIEWRRQRFATAQSI